MLRNILRIKKSSLLAMCLGMFSLTLFNSEQASARDFYFNTALTVLTNTHGQTSSHGSLFSISIVATSPAEAGVEPYTAYNNCIGPVSPYATTTIDGTPAYSLSSKTGVMINGVFYSLGLRSGGMEAYSSAGVDAYHWACTPSFTDINTHQKMDILLKIGTDGTVPITPGVYSVNTLLGTLYAQQGEGSIGSGGSVTPTDDIYLNTTLTVLASSCLLQTPKDIAIAWPTLTPSVIKNNAAESKAANISVACEDTNSHPITVTVTGSEGNESAANGIVKTSTEGLGLQLTWVNNGQPIPLNQPMDFNPGAAGNLTQDFSIAAKPVAINSGSISAGDFSSNVTVTFEYR